MAPIVPFIPLIASAVGVAGSAILQNQQNQRNKGLMNAQKKIAAGAEQRSNQLYQQGQQGVAPSMGYYSSMLANPREATAPEQNRINNMYAGQTANVRSQYGRGSYGPSGQQDIRNQQMKATQGVVQQGRPMAAGALMNAGLNLTAQGQGYSGLASGTLGNVFMQGLQARQQQLGLGAQLGGGLFGAYQNYLLGQAMRDPGQQFGYSPGMSFLQGKTELPTVPVNWPSGNLYSSSGGAQTGSTSTVPNSGLPAGVEGWN